MQGGFLTTSVLPLAQTQNPLCLFATLSLSDLESYSLGSLNLAV